MAAKRLGQASISRFFMPKPAGGAAADSPSPPKRAKAPSSPQTAALDRFAAGDSSSASVPRGAADQRKKQDKVPGKRNERQRSKAATNGHPAETTPVASAAQSNNEESGNAPAHKRVRRILVDGSGETAAPDRDATATATATAMATDTVIEVVGDETAVAAATSAAATSAAATSAVSPSSGARSASPTGTASSTGPRAKRASAKIAAAKLSGLDDFSRESAVEESSSAADGARDDNDEEAIPNLPSATEDRPLPRPPRGPGSVKRSAAEVKTELLREARTQKLTPLEKQFIEVKSEHPDAVLLVEVGYKFQFFGDDAEVAARILHIFCATGHNNFRVASIPVQRLFVHVRRLVDAGFKVGVVRQTETAALKKMGATKSKVFTRKLSALYTKSTLLGEEIGDDSGALDVASTTNYLMCITESSLDSDGSAVEFGIVALQCATGDIVYDAFKDDLSRQALETRLAHLDPSELLLPPQLSDRTEKVLRATAIGSGGDKREERMREEAFDASTGVRRITDFFGSAETRTAAALGTVLALPPPVQTCLAALVDHLRAFNLERILCLTSNFQPFSTQGTSLLMNANTLHNLEVLTNATDGRFEGSLLWMMDKTTTPFGRRLFRRWITHPLVDLAAIRARQAAVKELLESHELCLSEAKDSLAALPDLERGLCSVYYGRSSPAELVSVLAAMEQLHVTFKSHCAAAKAALTSELLLDVFERIADYFEVTTGLVSKLDASAAKRNDKVNLLVDCASIFPTQANLKADLDDVSNELLRHRQEVRKVVSNPVLEYVTVSGDDYLVEVKNKDVARVPKSWLKMSGTKSVARFRSPFIVEQLERRSQLRERLEIDASEAWLRFMASVSQHYEDLRRGVQVLAQFDCLVSLAKLAEQEHYTLPQLDADGEASIAISKGRHPVVSAAMSDQYVPNDTALVAAGQRCTLITGPNMGGKSSYIRQVALLVLMSQMGSYVPAEEAQMGVVDAIYTRMGASDNIFKGSSTFMVELQEAAIALQEATPRSLVIMDELGRGTSTHDGVAIAYATMKFLVEKAQCLTLFVTHYPSLAELAIRMPGQVACYHMAFMEVEDVDMKAAEDDAATVEAGQQSCAAEAAAAATPSAISFLYQLTPGLAQRSYGLNVARLAGIPESVLREAAVQSQHLENLVARRRPLDPLSAATIAALSRVSTPAEAQAAVAGLTQLHH